jgi:NAD-dependent deacetylase
MDGDEPDVKQNRIVAFTGAGISQESGVPTFAEMGDVREKLSRDFYLAYPQEFFDLLLQMKKTVDAAMPNAAHQALAQRHIPVVTMNIDGLHRRAGTEQLVELHGNLERVLCRRCGQAYPFLQVERDIHCPGCGAILDSDVVLYGDMIERYPDAFAYLTDCEILLVVGTSFYTSTASVCVQVARQAGARVEIINESAARKVPAFLAQILGS